MTYLWLAIIALISFVIFLTLWLKNLTNKVARMTWGGDGRIPGGE